MTATLARLNSTPDGVERVYRVLHDMCAASSNPLIAPGATALEPHPPRYGCVLQKSTLRGAVWDEYEAIAHAIAAGGQSLSWDDVAMDTSTHAWRTRKAMEDLFAAPALKAA